MEGLIDVGFFHFFLWVGNVAILDARHVLVEQFFLWMFGGDLYIHSDIMQPKLSRFIWMVVAYDPLQGNIYLVYKWYILPSGFLYPTYHLFLKLRRQIMDMTWQPFWKTPASTLLTFFTAQMVYFNVSPKKPQIGAEEFIKNKNPWTMIWSRFLKVMIWVYVNEGSRNGFEATKRKKTWPCLFVSNSSLFAAQMATLPKTNSLPLKMGRNRKGKDRLPTINFQGWFVSFRDGSCPGVTKWFCCHFGRSRMVGALPATGGDGINFFGSFLVSFQHFSQLNFLSNISA